MENYCQTTNDMMTRKLAKTTSTLIAPCGLNCRLCRAYVRNKRACPGCRGDDSFKSKTCATCPIKNCGMLTEGSFKYCFSCNEFPCARISHLEKRYTSRGACSGHRTYIAFERTRHRGCGLPSAFCPALRAGHQTAASDGRPRERTRALARY